MVRSEGMSARLFSYSDCSFVLIQHGLISCVELLGLISDRDPLTE